ncbi:thiamine pyrophosphate-dependent enzyme, possible carboligase or decarboxylase [Desulfocapsa sulfexigens DSM 10523]|uniref:Thiamine pyrophosphate-dependent enzyme, possible carboligase or decarboxylase n=1 Tax=Desulfocapsa sulfexigens (strain DSM 10523 / SB164P1) TaxID=1167006 RepID=M1PQ21_DESSD|nr:acetolactate synthase large subunit [Desulfocapsa sulfexigens]AGF78471.1 thiamine pyrophosphate-dependent enzyme, possible carboligase or decarboxylase [Desulfocapsa sulfexigens DSM 10523]
MNGAELLVQCLENEGVTTIFGIPGEENLAFLEALHNSSIRLILTRHEQAAGFMAATYGRLTGKPGVCLSTLGPGATNFVTAVSYSLLGGMPVVFITGQKPIKKSKQGRFQILDVVRMMGPLTKFTKQVVNAGTIPAMTRDMFRIAVNGKSGPVHMELPEDIAAEEVDCTPVSRSILHYPVADPEAISQAAEIIKKASFPLILFGAAANREQICPVALELIQATGLYFFTTQMGKGVVDEHSPQCLGTAALSDHDYIHCAIDRADVIINIGYDVVEKPPFFMNHGTMKVIHVHFAPADIDEVYFPQHEILGDISHSLRALKDALSDMPSRNTDYFGRIHKEINAHVFQDQGHDQFPNTPQHIVSDIRQTVAHESIVSLDNGMYKIWFARNFKACHSHSLLLDNALATMGAGFPAAISAKLVHPEKQVIAVCGDGGFMMNSQEIETAVRLGLHIVIIILRDNGYGMIKWKQRGMHFSDFGLDFGNPDFIQYAESYGAKGYRITENGMLSTVLTKCLNASGVHLIEVPVDYSENEKVFLQELQNKTCLL